MSEDNLEKYVKEQEEQTPIIRPISEMPLANRIGWIPVKMEDLPSMGLFYPKNTTIAIKSATAAEIRHWSTLREDDPYMLDEMINYVIERCVTVKSERKTEKTSYNLSWKDIKEIDRFYLILAIQELTFPDGQNKLTIKDKDKNVEVFKDMIDYIKFDENLMQYYNEEERMFTFKFNSGKILKLTIPSIGISQWLKNYLVRKRQSEETIEDDFFTYAMFYINEWRGLTEDTYKKYEIESNTWDIDTISMISYFRDTFIDAIDPKLTYTDEGGTEQKVPLNFQGGAKSIFIISDPFRRLG